MAAKFGYNIRTLANNNFLKASKTEPLNAWVPEKSYSLGDAVLSSGNKYISVTEGNALSGLTSSPDHTSGIEIDGGVSWIFVETITNNFSFRGNLYSFIGRGGDLDWDDDLNPPLPNLTDSGSNEIFENMITLKLISQNDMRFGIKRHDWTSDNGGEVYDQYDPNKDPYSASGEAAYTNPFYCMNGFNIYKCINNNNGSKSTIVPVNTSVNLINTSDGYTWKYMGSIESDDFLTEDHIPVEYKTFGTSAQMNVQNEAKNGQISTFKVIGTTGSINNPIVTIFSDDVASNSTTNTTATAFVPNDHGGNLTRVLVNDPGQNYYTNSVAIIRESLASGTGAFIYASDSSLPGRVIITNGVITSIGLANTGSNYVAAKVIIIGDCTTQATATATITSGSVSNITMVSGGTGYTYARAFIIPCISAISLYGGGVAETILSPKNGHGKNIVKELGANALIFNIKTTAESTGTGYYPIGKFRQMGIVSDIIKFDGTTFADDLFYIGQGHSLYNTQTVLNKCSPNYGELLYTSNFPAITRVSGQSENIRITIIF